MVLVFLIIEKNDEVLRKLMVAAPQINMTICIFHSGLRKYQSKDQHETRTLVLLEDAFLNLSKKISTNTVQSVVRIKVLVEIFFVVLF